MLFVAAFVVTINDSLIKSIKPFGTLKQTGQVLYSVQNHKLEMIENKFGQNLFFLALNLITGLFLYLVLAVINCIVIIRYRSYIRNKNALMLLNINMNNDQPEEQQQQQEERTNANAQASATRLLLAIVAIFLIGNIPISLCSIVTMVFGMYSAIAGIYELLSLFILALSHTSYILVYYFYCNTYKETILKFLFAK